MWADERPGGGYHIHDISSHLTASQLVSLNVQIGQDDVDHSKWHLDIGHGTYHTASTNNGMNPDGGDYGSESTSSSACSYSTFKNLAYESSNDRDVLYYFVYGRTYSQDPPQTMGELNGSADDYVGGIQC